MPDTDRAVRGDDILPRAERADVAASMPALAPDADAPASVADVLTTKALETHVSNLPLEVFLRPANAPAPDDVAAAPKAKEELIPGLKGWIDSLVSRRKTEPPQPAFVPDSSSITDRIARDFGLLDPTDP